METTVERGAHGEDLAADFLRMGGAEILARNWRSRCGEIDLIVRDGPTIAFVEVKTRQGRRLSGARGVSYRYGSPAEAVTFAKQARIRRLAAIWLAERAGRWAPVRFDVVAVTISAGALPVIEHLQGVF
jgi:putative endonuclease